MPQQTHVVYRLLFHEHENETFNSKRAGVALLTVHASARERKSLHDSASMCWAASLTLFSTGFGFWGLARTSPQFFSPRTLEKLPSLALSAK